MTVTVRYIGTTNPYFETALTGAPTKWTPGLSGDVSNADGAVLVASALFEQVVDESASGSFTQQDGRDYMIGPRGELLAITPLVGTYGQAEVGGVKQAVVTLDSGDDGTPHGDWAITYDCTLAGNPGVPDESVAGERFERADPNEIIISGLPGNVMAGIVYFPEFTTLSMVHIAQLGGSNYTNSGTATAGLNQFVRLDLPEGTIGLEIQAREPTGANGRYRQIVFTPFMARE